MTKRFLFAFSRSDQPPDQRRRRHPSPAPAAAAAAAASDSAAAATKPQPGGLLRPRRHFDLLLSDAAASAANRQSGPQQLRHGSRRGLSGLQRHLPQRLLLGRQRVRSKPKPLTLDIVVTSCRTILLLPQSLIFFFLLFFPSAPPSASAAASASSSSSDQQQHFFMASGVRFSGHTLDKATKAKVTLENYYSNLISQHKERRDRWKPASVWMLETFNF